MGEVIRVGVADDHPFAREGLVQLLRTAGDVVVVGEAADGRQVLDLVETGQEPDVVLVDVRMPGLDGFEVARRITREHPEVKVILLSAYDDPRQMVEAVRAGARGYVLKDVDGEELLDMVRVVAQGGMVVDLALVERLAGEAISKSPPDALTDEEIRILRLLADGRTNPELAEELGVSTRAVRYQLDRIFRKLGAHDRTAAVAEALRRHLID
ncbi:MAG TPA: response regulator transcription factor [Actinomycetota bacterium]|nr:response regulator transcription factor [Actinomycetota bacterium]